MHIYFEKPFGDFRILHNTQNDFWYPSHIHKGIELIYIFSGNLNIQLDECTHHLTDGDFAFISPGTVHSYSPDGFADFWLAIFDPYYVHSLFRNSLDNTVPERPVLPSSELSDDVRLAVNKTLNFQNNSQIPICTMWLQVILAEIFPLIRLKKTTRKKENMSLVSKITTYLSNHYLEPVTLDSLASELNLNHYYVSHLFSKNFHMPLPQYLNLLRIDHAVDLMQNTDLTLTQIWIHSGFQTQRSFNRAFSQVHGTSPSKYKKSLAQINPQFPDALSKEVLSNHLSSHH